MTRHISIKKLGYALVIVIFVITLMAPATSRAQETSLANQIAALLQQVQSLQAQLAALQGELEDIIQLTRTLSLGVSGDDITELQQLLAEDPDLYPEGLVTGYFGPLTERAVRRFQERFGIDQVGIVGPITRSTLNKLFKNKGKGKYGTFARIDDDDDDDDTIDWSEFRRGQGKHGVVVCHKGKTIAVGGPAVFTHLTRHGDSIGRCGDAEDDDDGNDDEGNDDDDNGEATEGDAEDAIDAAEAAIADAEDAIADADADGRDTDEADELLTDAKDALEEAEEEFDKEDYDDTVEAAEEAEELANDAQDAVEDEETQAQNALDDAQDAIDSAEDAIADADADGRDVADAENLLEDAKTMLEGAQGEFDKGDYDDALDEANQAEELADDAVDAIGEVPDDTDPVISGVSGSATASTTATIEWDTDENADSTVWYSTTSGFDTGDAGVVKVDDNDLVTSHSVDLEDLDPDTTYYFMVGSEDDSGNDAMSSEDSFATPAA